VREPTVNIDKGEIKSLTSLRALLAAGIVLYHYLRHGQNVPTTTDVWQYLQFCVDVFFVLSAFVLTLKYDQAQRFDQFMQRRIARTWPPYYVALLLGALGGNAINLWNFTFTQNFFVDVGFTTGVFVAWSLCVEQSFYLLFPAILRTTKNKNYLLVLWAVGAIAVGSLVSLIGQRLGLNSFLPSPAFALQWTLAGAMVEFCFGIWLARWYLRNGPPSPKRANFLFYCGILGTAGTLAFGSRLGWYVPFYPLNWFTAMCIGLIMLALTQPEVILSRLWNHPVAVWMGRISFSLYLVHLLPQLRPFQDSSLLAYYIACTVAAALLFYCVERPSQIFLSRRINLNARRQAEYKRPVLNEPG